MNMIRSLFEMILTEAVALTKGSQRVMNDKKMVADLADSLRDDAATNPSSFPPGSNRSFQRAPDEQLARWFLENLDNIEREGYEGTVYSRDGVNSEWIARRYIAGSHNWEDITGVMNMNLRDWYLLKNRNMLDANHKDLPKFNSVRDVGFYMTTHYKDQLEKVRDAARNAARNKMAKSVKLVDNDDYRIYTTLNRAAGCALGLGTQWCTANSNYGGHFHTYSNRAMLFQLFPYAKTKDESGNLVNVKDEDDKKVIDPNEKYQFDAGGPNFMDATDRPANPDVISKKFPYLYTDLVKGLKDGKAKMEQAFKDLSIDPTLQGEDYKIKTYEINDEIEKLQKFIGRGYFTDEVRPTKKSHAEEPASDLPPLPPTEPQVENLFVLGNNMLQEMGIFDQAELFEIDKFVEGLNSSESYSIGDRVTQRGLPAELEVIEVGHSIPNIPCILTVRDTDSGNIFKVSSSSCSKVSNECDAGQQPGIFDEPILKENIMENVDKDVAAMLRSLKKYDMLAESVAPVLEKKKPDADGDGVPDWADKKPGKDDNEEIDEAQLNELSADTLKKYSDAARWKAGARALGIADHSDAEYMAKHEKGAKRADQKIKDKQGDLFGDKKVKEAADPEVLEWMQRFAKLGNMKGYGR